MTTRYEAAAHAMQSGVATEMNYRSQPTESKHLRVGIKRVGDRSRGIRPSVFRPLIGTKASGIKLSLRPHARPIDRITGREF